MSDFSDIQIFYLTAFFFSCYVILKYNTNGVNMHSCSPTFSSFLPNTDSACKKKNLSPKWCLLSAPLARPLLLRNACFSLARRGSQRDRLTMLTLYMWKSVEAGDKVGPRATGTSARTRVFLLIVYIFYFAPPPPPPPSRSSTLKRSVCCRVADRQLSLSACSPSGARLQKSRCRCQGRRAALPRNPVVRNCTRGAESTVGVPTRLLEVLC